jgi:hypothetical protein
MSIYVSHTSTRRLEIESFEDMLIAYKKYLLEICSENFKETQEEYAFV